MSADTQHRQPDGTPAGGQFAPTAKAEPATVLAGRYINTERVRAIEKAITGVVLARFPDAAGWIATTTNEASRRDWHYYWNDEVEVLTPDGRGGFDVHPLELAATPAAGALYDGLNLHLPALEQGQPEQYQVAITADFHP